MQEKKSQDQIALDEFRCHNCRRLLYMATVGLDVEALCPGCRRINYPSRINDPLTGLRGKEFQGKSLDHLCSGDNCFKLLFRSIGLGIVEGKCPTCKVLTIYDTKFMRSGKFSHTKAGKKARIKRINASS